MTKPIRVLLGAAILLLVAGVFGPAGKVAAAPRESIVYTDGSKVIFRINPDGSDQTELLQQFSGDPSRAVPSPSGTPLLSLTDRLWTSLSDGTGAVDISTVGMTYTTGYAYSPDGSQIAFSGRDSSMTYNSVYRMNADGSGLTQLTTAARHQMVLDWGAAGILFRGFDAGTLAYPVHRVDPGTGTIVQLGPSNFNVISAKYSVDGSRILMAGQYKGVSGGNRIFVMNADGTGITEIVASPVLVPNSVAWAPDGSDRAAVTARPEPGDGVYHVFQMDLGTGAATQLASNLGTSPANYIHWGLVDDPLQATSMTAYDVSGAYSDSVVLRARLTSGGAGLAGKTVSFRVGGVPVGTATTDAAGDAFLPYLLTVPASTLAVDAEFTGDAAYSSSLGSAVLTVVQESGSLAYTGDTNTSGGPLLLRAQLAESADGSSGDLTLAGDVEFVLKRWTDGSVVGTYTGAIAPDGSASVTTAALPNEPYTVDVSLLANGYYVAPPISVVITTPTALVTGDETGAYSDPVTLVATLSPAVAGKSVDFYVGGTLVGAATTDGTGLASLPYVISRPAGTYTITASFTGDGGYEPSVDDATLTVLTESGTLAYVGDTLSTGGAFTLSASLTQDPDGSLGNLALAGTVQFDLFYKSDGTAAGTYSAAVDGAGVATVSLASLAARSYDVVVTLLPNGYYTAAPASDVIQTQPVMTVDPVGGQYSDSVTLRATLTADGGGLAGRTVDFYVDGTLAGNGTTDASGAATLAYLISLPAGSYTVMADFAGDGTYVATSGSDTLTVTAEGGTLAYAGDLIADGGAFTLSGTLTEAADGSPGDRTQAGSLQFQVKLLDGTVVGTYTAPVDGAGAASVTIPALAANAYDIVTSLPANGYYTAPAVTTRVKGATALSAANVAGVYSDSVTLEATLTLAGGGAGIAGETLTFSVDGVVVGSAVTDGTGKATLAYLVSLPAGTYPIDVTYAGSGNYEPSPAAAATLTVAQEGATLTYTGDTVTDGGAFTLAATVAEVADGSPGSIALAGTVEFELVRNADGTVAGTYSAAVDGAGNAVVNLASLAADAYTVTVRLLANGYYSAPNATAQVKGATAVAVANVAGIYSDSVTLEATLTRLGGGGLAGQTVNFTVDGVAVGAAVTDGTGKATLSYTVVQGAGSYVITADFGGDADYGASSGSGTLTVSQESGSLTYTGDTLATGGAFTLSAALADDADGMPGNLALAGTVQFDLTYRSDGTAAGTYTATVDGGGVAAVSLASLAARSYDVVVTLLANSYYTAAPASDVIQTQPTLDVDPVSGQYSDSVTLRATFTADGGGVSGRTIAFYVDGTPVGNGTTDASGAATLAYMISLPAGTYSVVADFAGDGTYVATSGSDTLTVTAEGGTLAYTGDLVADGGAFTLSATLTEAADGSPGDLTQAGSLQFQVKLLDGTVVGTYTAAVDGAGAASVTLPSLAADAYDIVTSLPANGYYTAPAVTTRVKGATALSAVDGAAQYSDPVTLEATLTLAGGAGIAGETVNFSVDGLFVGAAVTDGTGKATLPYTVTLSAGTYPVDVTYGGSASYEPSAGAAQLTVAQEGATLAYTGGTTADGGAFTLRAVLTEAADGSPGSIALAGTIEFTLIRVSDGSAVGTYSATVDGSGTAVYNLPSLAADAYDVTVSLVPNGYYSAPDIVQRVTAVTSVSVAPVSGQYSDSVTLSATLTPAMAGQSISFSLNGIAVGAAVTDGTGTAVLPYTIGDPAGTYLIEASFAGDANYSASLGSDNLTVTREDATVDYTGDLTSDGSPISLSATVGEAADGSPGTISNAGSVQFELVRLRDGAVIGTYTAAVDGAGNASTTAPVAAEAYQVNTSLVANGYYTAPADSDKIQGVTTLSVAAPAGQYSDSVTLQATLLVGATGVNGRAVSFSVDGAYVGDAVTDGSGVASLPYSIGMAAGSYSVDATFAGDADYLGSSGSNLLTANPEAATLTYTGSIYMAPSAIVLAAVANQEADGAAGDMTLAGLDFTFNGTTYSVANLDGSGAGSVSVGATPDGIYTVTSTLVGRGYFTASSINTTVYVDGTPPTTPTVSYSVSACGVFRLSYSASDATSGVNYYNIYRDGVLIAGNVTAATYDDEINLFNTNVLYEVEAVDQVGNTSAHGSVTATQGDCAAISSVSINNGASPPVSVTFTVNTPDSMVQIRFDVLDKQAGTYAVLRTFNAWATPQLYATPGTYTINVNWDPSGLATNYNYAMDATIFFGSTNGSLTQGNTVRDQNFRLQ